MRAIALLFVPALLPPLPVMAETTHASTVFTAAAALIWSPTPTKVEISPDGERVTFLRAKTDDQTTYDLWEYNVKARKTRLLLDSKKLVHGEEQLTDAEKARRERARVAGRHGFVDYTWAPDGKKLLFPLNGKLYLYDVTVSDTKALRELPAGGSVIDAQVSPKGRYVSYVLDQKSVGHRPDGLQQAAAAADTGRRPRLHPAAAKPSSSRRRNWTASPVTGGRRMIRRSPTSVTTSRTSHWSNASKFTRIEAT